MSEEPRLLISQGEASRRLGICTRTLLGEIRAGRLKYVLVGKRRHFKPSDLDAYIENQMRGWPSSTPNETARFTRTLPWPVVDFEEALALTAKRSRENSPSGANAPRSSAKLRLPTGPKRRR